MALLKQGSKGKAVTALQTMLKTLGFDPGAIDGKFGPGTKAALISFQKSKGLLADGKAGPNTMAALQPDKEKPAPGPQVPATGKSVGGLSLDGLKGKVPDSVIAQIPETAAKFNITSNLRLAHFLAQCALESTGFKATVENLNYSGKNVFCRCFRNTSRG